jgi:regulator of replication initiation timing
MGILENAKSVASAVHEINNLELYQRVLGLHSDIIELVEQNNKLRAETEDLKKKLQLRQQMNFKEPFYFQDGDSTPHCSGCWETKNQAVHVVKVWDSEGKARWDCPICKHNYFVKFNSSFASPPYHHDPFGPGGQWS